MITYYEDVATRAMSPSVGDFDESFLEQVVRETFVSLLTAPHLIRRNGWNQLAAWGSVQDKTVADLLDEMMAVPEGVKLVREVMLDRLTAHVARVPTDASVDANAVHIMWTTMMERFSHRPVMELLTTPRKASGFYNATSTLGSECELYAWEIPEGRIRLLRTTYETQEAMTITGYKAELLSNTNAKKVEIQAHYFEALEPGVSTDTRRLRDLFSLASDIPLLEKAVTAWHRSGQMAGHDFKKAGALVFTVWERKVTASGGAGAAALEAFIKAMRQIHPKTGCVVFACQPAGWPSSADPLAADEVIEGVEDARLAISEYLGKVKPERWLSAGVSLHRVLH